MTLAIDDRLEIPLDEFDFQYVRSSGPGGQNVNKVATKAVLRWPVTVSPSLPEPVRDRFLERHGNRVNAEGELVLSCDSHRSQTRNAEACLERLRELILEVLTPPAKRKKTRPSFRAKRRRLEAKRRRGSVKKLRRPPKADE